MGEGTISNDGRALIVIVVLILAALWVFGGKPDYIAAGPVHLGDEHGQCHGMTNEGQPVLVWCK